MLFTHHDSPVDKLMNLKPNRQNQSLSDNVHYCNNVNFALNDFY